MTFQIGMVGRDGVLLASDMKRTYVPNVRGCYRSSSEQPKIIVPPGGHVAYCCSGDELTEAAARLFCDRTDNFADDSAIKKALEGAAQEAMSQARMPGSAPLSGGSSLFAYRSAREKIQLWCLEMRSSLVAAPHATPEFKHVINGDRGNPAGFFIERYFQQCKPIQDLVALAAHTILIAGRLNPAGVSGLEIVFCTAKGFERVSEDGIAELIERSGKLDADIAASLGLPTRTY